jgi:ABC-type glutathione transport system ATPase component
LGEYQMEALLRIKDLSVRYRTDSGAIHCAVSGATFEIGDGEAVGLVGESGCGKTSLGLALLGLHDHGKAEVTGSALFAGRDLLTLDERSLQQVRGAKIALISQDLGLALSPVLRVGDQIAEVLHAHSGQSWNQCRTEAAGWLMRVGLTPARRMFSAFPHQLSGGQLQRVLLAQALICKPSLLIADEPTAALDVRNQAEFVALLGRLRAEFGLSILLISHAPEIQARLADRLLVMKDGRIIEQGKFAQIYHNPSHPYTRAMLWRSVAGRPVQSAEHHQLIGRESLAL